MTEVPIEESTAGQDVEDMADVITHVMMSPWVLLVAKDGANPDSCNVQLHIGGGIHDTDTLRFLLTKTLDALGGPL